MTQNYLLALACATLVGLSGCAATGGTAQTEAKPAAQANPAISPEAQAALETAQADVKAARAKNALWTTAENALKAAEAAAVAGDSATVLKQAKLASEHVRLGLEQLNYPPLKVGD
jgi:murein lipoprotein